MPGVMGIGVNGLVEVGGSGEQLKRKEQDQTQEPCPPEPTPGMDSKLCG